MNSVSLVIHSSSKITNLVLESIEVTLGYPCLQRITLTPQSLVCGIYCLGSSELFSRSNSWIISKGRDFVATVIIEFERIYSHRLSQVWKTATFNSFYLIFLHFIWLRNALPERNSWSVFIVRFREIHKRWRVYLITSWSLIWHSIVFVCSCWFVLRGYLIWSSSRCNMTWPKRKCICANLFICCHICLCIIMIEISLGFLDKLHWRILALSTKASMRISSLNSWEEWVSVLIVIYCNIAPCINGIWADWDFRLLSPHILTSWNWMGLTTWGTFLLIIVLCASHSQEFNLFICPLEFCSKFFYNEFLLLNLS